MAATILSRTLAASPSFLTGSTAHVLQTPQCRSAQTFKACGIRAKMAEPTDEDMANVGLDDVFNLIAQAEKNDPSPDVQMDSKRRLTGWARWYKEFGKSLPKGVDATKALYGPERPKWKGAFTSAADVPDYLKGQYAGDYGIDVLGFCKDEKAFARLRAQELFNARWAMLGVVGMLYPEFFPASEGFEPVWFKAGAQIFDPAGIDYLGAPNAINAHSIVAVAVAQAVLMGGAEFARLKAPKGMDGLYPGGKAFDPLGFSTDPESLAELKVKEIKNGRLAMLAAAGLFAQGALTGVGPLQNLKDWLHF